MCHLYWSFYGLKQAPQAWHDKLKDILYMRCFTCSILDTSLFNLKTNRDVMWVLVYVDDIIITGSNSNHIDSFIKKLNRTFSLKDLSSISFFLGIEAHLTSSSLYLSQKKIHKRHAHKINMLDCQSSPTPVSTSIRLSKYIGNKFFDILLYKSSVGALQYVLLTRPGLSFNVNQLSQFI